MVSRKEIEERRRKDEMEAAYVFEEFIETFQSTTNKPVSKTWVKAGIINADKSESIEENIGTLYKPLPRFKCQDKLSVEQAQECARILPTERKNDTAKKRKSNLESFKEELELLHKDREEKQKLKNDLKIIDNNFTIEQSDPNSTNLYVNNLNTKMSETQLIDLFGQYGPLASVKIMWPRSEEERSRNKNCGFVAYMSRKDAERGLKNLNNKIILGCELKVGWGKSVLIPSHPIYIPPCLLEVLQPPPVSGLPFNAQPPKVIPKSVENFDELIKLSTVKVVMPTDRNIIALIHRTIEFVCREGFLFEALMMTREINNPSFRFLFDNHCSAHVYYRWKLYSILHGDSVKDWSTKEFRMFKGGSIWKPPMKHDYCQGMPEELIENSLENIRKTLSTTQRDNLEILIHKLTPERSKIAEGLIFCLNHREALEEIAECITQALESNKLPIKKIIARLYLISDILYNTKSNLDFKNSIEIHLPKIMKTMSDVYELLKNQQKQIFFVKIARIFNSWIYLKIFPADYLEHLYKIFTNSVDKPNEKQECEIADKIESESSEEDETINICKENEKEKIQPGFIPSRWEIVDPDVIESQAMTTVKWSQLQENENSAKNFPTKSRDISEDRRKKLREIEVKVMQYQDELEMDRNKTIPMKKIVEQVENYRKKLIRQYEEKLVECQKKYSRKRKSESPKKSKSSSKKSTKHDY